MYYLININLLQVDTAKAPKKTYELSESGGLYLLVNPTGITFERLDEKNPDGIGSHYATV